MIDTQAIRSKILDLAMRGKLTEQLPEDGTAEELYRQIQKEKQKLIKAGKIKKEKPLPEISDEEVPYSIPANWKWMRIGAVLTLQSGKNITATDIKNNTEDNHMIPCYGGNGQRGFVSQANVDGFHAIIGRQGALCGNINFAEGPFYATEHAVVVYGYAGTNMKWAGITLRSLNLNQYATSVAQPGLAVNKIENVLMPLPPLAEQHRIVARIEQAFSALDTIDALQAKYADNLAVLKSKLIDAAIQGKLTEQLPEDGTAEELYRRIQAEKQALIKAGKIKKEKPLPEIAADEIPFEIPANWKWVRLGLISSQITDGEHKTPRRVSDFCGYYLLSARNVANDAIKLDNVDYVDEKEFDIISRRCNPKRNDVLISCSGSVGRCCVVEDDNKYVMVRSAAMVSLIKVHPKWVMYCIHSTALQKQISNKAKATAQANLFQEPIKRLVLPLPPLAEQKRIVNRLTELLAVCDELRNIQ